MYREALMTELELMPLWRLRAAPVVQALPLTELTAVALTDANGMAGWLLLAEPLQGDAAALSTQMLQAMHLQQSTSVRIEMTHLADAVARSGVSWLWLMGEAVTQSVLAQPLTAPVRQQWQGLPVLLSEHPQSLLLQPGGKAKFWADWCRWQNGV